VAASQSACAIAAICSLLAAAALSAGCTTIDPGPNFAVPNTTFDPNYFYCHVEPQFIFAYSCGTGDPSQHDAANGCHFNPSAVSGMALLNHTPVDCGGGDIPLDMGQVATGSAAASNYEAVSIEMNADYMSAPLWVRPSGDNHPRRIFQTTDTTVMTILGTWASL
jgi:hypothetical protein